jgi:exodeoxyribonuclease V alpha subunit
MMLHETQQAAVDAAITGPKLRIITGGAGTGKTTLIKAIADKVHNCELVAFAGKAAARLREATNHPAGTIHRLLRYDGVRFSRESLAGVTVVVDEASMVSSALLAAIVKTKPARIVLVGDEAQLPPVGVGQPFHDLIVLRSDLVSDLTICWRQTEAVYAAANAIRDGIMPADRAESERERWEIAQTGGAEATHNAILDVVRAGGVSFDDGRDMILSPRNGQSLDDACTVRALNESIAAIVNPRAPGDDDRIRIGDRVICTRNHADADVWNGSTGTVTAIDADKQPWVRLDGGERVLFKGKMRQDLQLAYALTVHKAQGSQAERVIIACTARDTYQYDRAMLYTAVTRTSRQCTVMGERAALASAINTVRDKRTVLQQLASVGASNV